MSYFQCVLVNNFTYRLVHFKQNTSIVLRKESFNGSGDQQCHQYQQNEQPTTYHLESLNTIIQLKKAIRHQSIYCLTIQLFTKLSERYANVNLVNV